MLFCVLLQSHVRGISCTARARDWRSASSSVKRCWKKRHFKTALKNPRGRGCAGGFEPAEEKGTGIVFFFQYIVRGKNSRGGEGGPAEEGPRVSPRRAVQPSLPRPPGLVPVSSRYSPASKRRRVKPRRLREAAPGLRAAGTPRPAGREKERCRGPGAGAGAGRGAVALRVPRRSPPRHKGRRGAVSGEPSLLVLYTQEK